MSSLWVHQAAQGYACARQLGLRPGVVKPIRAFWVRGGGGKVVCVIFDISLATDLLQTSARHQSLSMDYSMHPASLWARSLQWAESRESFLAPSLPMVIVGRYT